MTRIRWHAARRRYVNTRIAVVAARVSVLADEDPGDVGDREKRER